MKLKDRIVLVTGGNSGIGRAIVEVLADTGMRVAFSYRVPCYTTIPSASAAVKAIEMRKKAAPSLVCLQDLGLPLR